MYIMMFSHYFPPEGNAPASRAYENCRNWVRQGHKIKVITCAPNVPDGKVYKGYKNKLYQKENVDGIDVVRVWTYIAANKGKARRILNYVSYMFSAAFFSLFLKKPDIIIATSPQFFCAWAGIITSRLRRVPFILEIRDIWPESIAAVGAMRHGFLLRLLEWLEMKMYAAAQEIVTVGEGYRQELIAKKVQSAKISVIHNGFDPNIFYPRRAEEKLRRNYNLDHEFICSYVGTIGMASGLDVVLRAAKLLKDKERKDIKFLLVGAGAMANQLQQQARQQNLDNVFFLGRIDRHLIPSILSMSDVCLVHLRKAEIFKTVLPSKIFEAAAMAKPIILGVEGCAAELIKKANAGICIEPENAKQLLAAVENLAENPALCRSLGQSGYEYVRKYHDRDKLAEDYLDVINYTLVSNQQKYDKVAVV